MLFRDSRLTLQVKVCRRIDTNECDGITPFPGHANVPCRERWEKIMNRF